MIKTIISIFAFYQCSSANRLLLQRTVVEGNIPDPIPTEPATRPPLNPDQRYGAFNQICEHDARRWHRVHCKTTSESVADYEGILECSRANDCCLCNSIKCGSLDHQNCKHIIAGDNAVFGVKDIQVFGSQILGAYIECQGENGCADAQINGQHVSELGCIGQNACKNAKVFVEEPHPNFKLKCEVGGSCEGLDLELHFPAKHDGPCNPAGSKTINLGSFDCLAEGACKDSHFTIRNDGCDRILIEGVECWGGACEGAHFDFAGTGNTEIGGCELPGKEAMPSGLDGCWKRLRSMICRNPASCANDVRTIVDPVTGFEWLCEGERACMGSTYIVDISNKQRVEKEINLKAKCGAISSCQNMNVAVMNANEAKVNLEIDCAAIGACNGAEIYGGHNVNIKEIKCADPTFCIGCTFNDKPCYGAHY